MKPDYIKLHQFIQSKTLLHWIMQNYPNLCLFTLYYTESRCNCQIGCSPIFAKLCGVAQFHFETLMYLNVPCLVVGLRLGYQNFVMGREDENTRAKDTG